MLNLDAKTSRIVAAFAAVATTMTLSGCDYAFSGSEGWKTGYNDRELVDDNGETYTLHRNDDGTETASYGDGREVTFNRRSDGSLDVISGAGALLPALAASYFLFNNHSAPGGRFDGTRYVVNERPYELTDRERREEQNSRYGSSPSSSKSKSSKSVGGAKAPGSSGTVKKSSTSGSSVKSGFGGAGARSASS